MLLPPSPALPPQRKQSGVTYAFKMSHQRPKAPSKGAFPKVREGDSWKKLPPPHEPIKEAGWCPSKLAYASGALCRDDLRTPETEGIVFKEAGTKRASWEVNPPPPLPRAPVLAEEVQREIRRGTEMDEEARLRTHQWSQFSGEMARLISEGGKVRGHPKTVREGAPPPGMPVSKWDLGIPQN